MSYVRPGPLSIHPGSSPGGVVVHIYSVPDQRLLRVSTIGPDDNIEQIVNADTAAIAALACDVCLVAYDGDTGERAQWDQH